LISISSDEPTGRLALVFELMEMNLYEAIKGKPSNGVIAKLYRTTELHARSKSEILSILAV
jgi:hypothetical protein